VRLVDEAERQAVTNCRSQTTTFAYELSRLPTGTVTSFAPPTLSPKRSGRPSHAIDRPEASDPAGIESFRKRTQRRGA
jgi:hypothetical protein